jgi:hypothetical protein
VHPSDESKKFNTARGETKEKKITWGKNKIRPHYMGVSTYLPLKK